MKRFTLMLLAAMAIACPAAAGDIFQSTFMAVEGSRPCYARIYDATHLKAHPRQTVRGIEVDFTPLNPDGGANTAAKFELGFAFRLRAFNGWFGDSSYCTTKNGGFDCYLDADGGLYRITPKPDGLHLDIVDRGGTRATGDQIGLEAEESPTGAVGFGRLGGDDRHFILPRADHKICDAANAQ